MHESLINIHTMNAFYSFSLCVNSLILLFLRFRAFGDCPKITIPYIHRCLFVG